MKLVKYNPLTDFIPSTFGSLLESAINENTANHFEPKVDIIKHEDGYDLQFIVPGFNKSDFELHLENNVLKVTGQRNLPEDKDYIQIESAFGSFERSFRLGEKTDTKGIKAAYENGILTISLPTDKKKVAKKQISID